MDLNGATSDATPVIITSTDRFSIDDATIAPNSTCTIVVGFNAVQVGLFNTQSSGPFICNETVNVPGATIDPPIIVVDGG